MFVARKSAWTYTTSGSMGAGYGIYAAEIGELVLKNPTGQEVKLKYGGAGIGPGIGVKMPKAAPRLIKRFVEEFAERELSGGVGPFSFTSSGTIYVTRWCTHPDLQRQDFSGGCMFGEINIGLVKSRSLTLFLLGMDLATLASMANMAELAEIKVSDIMAIPPRAIILAKGTGLGVGIGADIYAGGVV